MSAQPVKGFDASVSVTTAKRKEQETISENLHSKTFTAWVNHQLQRKGVKIGSVLEDFKDGVSFVQLMEAVFKKKNDKKLNLNPTTEIHRIENVAIAIDMLKVHDPTVQINSKDITDANRKLTLGLIWRLIQSNQMLAPEDTSKSVTQRNKQAKGNLVEFCKKQTEGYEGVQINDLVESFYDGLAFAAIVDKLNPGALNWSEIQKDDPKTRLQKAFDAAEKLLGIPQLLDPEDMVKEDHDLRPDEKCIMTYISEFPLALVERNKNEALKKEKNLADELDRELQKQRELEEQRKREKDQGEDLTKSKENEADKLKNETDLLKAQREEVMAAARARKEDLKTQNEVLAEDNKRLLEEIARIKEETKKLRKDIKSTKNKLIGKLNVVIKEARNLPVMNIGGKSDAYCRIKLETQELKTKIKKKTLNPKWEQEYEFFVTDKSSELDVALWNWDRFSSDDFIGKVVIKISDLKDGTADTKWYNLMSANLEDPAKGEVSLTISFKLGK